MPYYTSEQEAASRRVLGRLLSAAPDAILIGGWGTWVRCGGLMSHDIDMIIDRTSLAALTPLLDVAPTRNARLGGKQSSEFDGVHVDIYLPYESIIGARAKLRAESLARHPDTVGAYRVLTPEAHIVSKMAALLDRPETMKGQKDRHEIIDLFRAGADAAEVGRIFVASSGAGDPVRLIADAFDHLARFEPLPGEPAWGREERRWVRDLRASATPAGDDGAGGSPDILITDVSLAPSFGLDL